MSESEVSPAGSHQGDIQNVLGGLIAQDSAWSWLIWKCAQERMSSMGFQATCEMVKVREPFGKYRYARVVQAEDRSGNRWQGKAKETRIQQDSAGSVQGPWRKNSRILKRWGGKKQTGRKKSWILTAFSSTVWCWTSQLHEFQTAFSIVPNRDTAHLFSLPSLSMCLTDCPITGSQNLCLLPHATRQP